MLQKRKKKKIIVSQFSSHLENLKAVGKYSVRSYDVKELSMKPSSLRHVSGWLWAGLLRVALAIDIDFRAIVNEFRVLQAKSEC
jgi:hypothetical protein